MKNKKLFAILTLVCFMFTLMPVAAFAATTYVDIDDDYSLVNVGDEVEVVVGPIAASDYPNADAVYFFATNSAGELYRDFDVVKIAGTDMTGRTDNLSATKGVEYASFVMIDNDGNLKVTVKFADNDTYKVYAVAGSSSNAAEAIKKILDDASMLNSQKVGLLKQEAFDNLDTTVEVKDKDTKYHFCGTATHGTAVTTGTATIAKANGVTKDTVELYLHDAANDPVVGKEVTISTNSSAVDVSKTKVTTDAAGRVKFDVTATIAGEYKVYVEYGNKADVVVTVTAGTTGPADIETKYNAGKVDLDTTLAASGIMFTITDINGNIINNQDLLDNKTADKSAAAEEFFVRVTEAPAGSAITNKSLQSAGLAYDADEAAWVITNVELDVEGDYEFKVILENGAFATATVTVKEFQTPVAIELAYQAPSVELNGYNYMKTLKFVDANGVKTTNGTDEIKLAAKGYAVDTFIANENVKVIKGYQTRTSTSSAWVDATKAEYDKALAVDTSLAQIVYYSLGAVKAEADEKYVGSTIDVTAVSQKYNLVATTSMVVANEAAEVKYASTEADVAVNNTLVANIVDVDGNKVALNNVVGKANISYVVLEKPEGAKVAVSTANADTLATKGQFKVSFTASEIGTYKLQTLVTYEQANGVVKYYTGIEDITVGNTGFEDIVVMSVGSNEIVVNAETKAIDAAPMIANNRTFVPFRALAEAFGAEVAYDEATQAVTAVLKDTTVVMTVGSAAYTVNGVEKTDMDVAPFIVDGRTMVPVRFAAQAFGITVTPTYDANGATADVLFAK